MALEILNQKNKVDYKKLCYGDLIECLGSVYLVSQHPTDQSENMYISIRTGICVRLRSSTDINIKNNNFRLIEKGTTLIYK